MDKHSLQQQVSQLKRKNIENEDLSDVRKEDIKKPMSAELGSKSIFYDPDWNPSGKAPFGLKNIPYNARTFRRDTPIEPRLNGLKEIPLPKPNIKDQEKKSS
ncbi:Aim4 [Kluyveromyces lactis]|nr:Aim4 [Kluyveromyces lactis]